jgi:hypothetical protein
MSRKIELQSLGRSGDRKKHVRVNRVPTRDIAIIGMGARYPDAPNKDIFWANLRAGRDSVAEFPLSGSGTWNRFMSILHPKN